MAQLLDYALRMLHYIRYIIVVHGVETSDKEYKTLCDFDSMSA